MLNSQSGSFGPGRKCECVVLNLKELVLDFISLTQQRVKVDPFLCPSAPSEFLFFQFYPFPEDMSLPESWLGAGVPLGFVR